jgi:hypothetical protein
VILADYSIDSAPGEVFAFNFLADPRSYIRFTSMLLRDRGDHFTTFNFDSPAGLRRSLRGTQLASCRFAGGAAKLNSIRGVLELALLRFALIQSLKALRNTLLLFDFLTEPRS